MRNIEAGSRYTGVITTKSAIRGSRADEGVCPTSVRHRGDNGGLGYPCRPRRAMAVSGVVHELGAGPGCGGGGASGSGGFLTLRSSR